MNIENFKKYTIQTPDTNTITFLKIPYEFISLLLKGYSYAEKEIKQGLTSHKMYELENGMRLFEKTLDFSYYLLFFNEKESGKYFSGQMYWKVFVHLDQIENVYSCFDLKCDKTIGFVNNSIDSDRSLSIKGNGLKYILYKMNDGRCCYLSHRINDWYDGYWFNSAKDFDFIYKNIIN